MPTEVRSRSLTRFKVAPTAGLFVATQTQILSLMNTMP